MKDSDYVYLTDFRLALDSPPCGAALYNEGVMQAKTVTVRVPKANLLLRPCPLNNAVLETDSTKPFAELGADLILQEGVDGPFIIPIKSLDITAQGLKLSHIRSMCGLFGTRAVAGTLMGRTKKSPWSPVSVKPTQAQCDANRYVFIAWDGKAMYDVRYDAYDGIFRKPVDRGGVICNEPDNNLTHWACFPEPPTEQEA